ncbi:MAG TPA: hypothetical protein VG433_08440 [Pirellulales bacterium]|jgi:hypothetical protein|nr:hypothetical protein [Pirellulales bacterium]
MPAAVVSHADWMKETAVTMRIRSSQLKELDAAIKKFEELSTKEAFDAIKLKLTGWKNLKGAGWKTNDRNKSGMITKLDNQITAGWKDFDQGTVEAWRELAKLRKEFLAALFKNARVNLGGASKAKTAVKEVVKAASPLGTVGHASYQLATKSIPTAASSTASVLKAANAASIVATIESRIRMGMASEASKVFTQMGLSKLASLASFEAACEAAFQQVVGRAVHDLAVAIAPYVGIASAAAKTAFYTYCVADSTVDLYRVSAATGVIETGDPLAAMAAVSELVKRELATNTLKLGASATELTLKAVGGIFDGGTVSTVAAGLASSVVQAVWDIRCAIRDVAEMTAANTFLANADELDNSIFVKAPLVGAYFVCCADDSTLLSLLLDKDNCVPAGFGTPSFMNKIENAKKEHLNKVQTVANHLVNNHRMRIVMGDGIIPKLGLANTRTSTQGDLSMRSPNMTMQLKREARIVWQELRTSAEALASKAKGGSSSTRPAAVDRSRIVGMGSGTAS